MRLFIAFVGIAIVVSIPFAIWGARLETLFTGDGAIRWLSGYGSWAWAAALLLLSGDLFLPIPGTAVLSALGYLYGTVVGGAIGAFGTVVSGGLAYGLSRGLGHDMAVRIAGSRDLERGERLFKRRGGWIVAVSRWLPILPETVACMAGLTRMPFSHFLVALICGAIPLAFTFAAIGASGVDRPALAIGLSAGLPLLLWPVAHRLLGRGSDDSVDAG